LRTTLQLQTASLQLVGIQAGRFRSSSADQHLATAGLRSKVSSRVDRIAQRYDVDNAVLRTDMLCYLLNTPTVSGPHPRVC
ncbi:MAG TPA: hypothetical protein VF177_10305, partial [Anaerolineae bacterium]